MAFTSALLGGMMALNVYLRSTGREKASAFVAVICFNTGAILSYILAPEVLALVNRMAHCFNESFPQ